MRTVTIEGMAKVVNNGAVTTEMPFSMQKVVQAWHEGTEYLGNTTQSRDVNPESIGTIEVFAIDPEKPVRICFENVKKATTYIEVTGPFIFNANAQAYLQVWNPSIYEGGNHVKVWIGGR